MSLDVYLTMEDTHTLHLEPQIFIREDGQNKQITRAEWDERHPGREPVTFPARIDDSGIVYHANITHNLNTMAAHAGIYLHLWKPGKIGISQAKQLIEPLTLGLAVLKRNPDSFKVLNPSNGWGTYEGLIGFVEDYLSACKQYPQADVSVSR